MNANQTKLIEALSKAPPSTHMTGTGSAYWNGFNGVANKFLKTSLAYAAWVAGRNAAEGTS